MACMGGLSWPTSLVQPTRKFLIHFPFVYRRSRRWIQTNRQFGNLLVLQAAYRSQLLRPIVHPDDLKYLMEETIQFLKHLTPISPALCIDAAILESSMKTLDFHQNTPNPNAVHYNSFGEHSGTTSSPFVSAPLSTSRWRWDCLGELKERGIHHPQAPPNIRAPIAGVWSWQIFPILKHINSHISLV